MNALQKYFPGVLLMSVALALFVAGHASSSGTLVTGDNSSLFPTTNKICSGPVQTLTQVGTGVAAVPATAAVNRRFITVCNSNENASGTLIKCLDNGPDAGAPVIGLGTGAGDAGSGNPGDVLAVGQCTVYSVSAGITVDCVSNNPNSGVISTECR